jgi:hypothetical protein
MEDKVKNEEQTQPRDRRFGGLLLLGIGLLMLLTNFTRSNVLGDLILPGLGLLFLAWAFYTRRFGLTVPGCILTGLGIGVLLESRVSIPGDSDSGGVVVLGLAAGFLAIALIAPFFEQKRVFWPLIPGGILALVGILQFMGDIGLQGLNVLGTFWPVILVAVGLYILFVPRHRET